MLTIGEPFVRTREDGYTIVTRDGLQSAHFEHTVVITVTGVKTLTSAAS